MLDDLQHAAVSDQRANFAFMGVVRGFQVADPIVGIAITAAAILMVLKNAARDIYRRADGQRRSETGR